MNTGKLSFIVLISIIFFGLSVFSAVKASPTDTIMHSFGSITNDGSGPYDSLILAGSKLWGVTQYGGINQNGTIFSINTDGTGYTKWHDFGSAGDGIRPFGSLTLSADGNTLYGTTTGGGSHSNGTIFSISTTGSGYSVLYNFVGFPGDGGAPFGSLTLAGSKLFGMTSVGGSNQQGTIFSINTDGTGYTKWHDFGSAGDGSRPFGSLTLSADGNTLYGTTSMGGDSSSDGTIFSINTDGTGYSVLYNFDEISDDGNTPYGSLIILGNKLYGTTEWSGDSDNGTIFSISITGTGYITLHDFLSTAGPNDGSRPQGSLTFLNGMLYGFTGPGGNYSDGTIFSINADGTGYSVLYNFSGGSNNGTSPEASPIISNYTLYGTTQSGGLSNLGTIFSFPLTPPNSAPSLTAGPSGPSSSVTVGGTASFNATATTTPSTDNYYLAICKNNSITPNPSSPPTCGGLGAWCVSPSTASGSQANCSYTTQQSDIATDPNPWYAFVCDNNSNPLCSSVSQGTGSTASPFTVSAPAPTPAPTPTVTAGGGGAMIFLQMLQARQQTQTQASTPTPAPTQTSTASLAASIRQQLSSLITQLIGMLRLQLENRGN